MKLLQEAEDQLARYTTAALKAGVEQRQMDLMEGQAQQLAGAINRILDSLDLAHEQQQRIPTVVPNVLRQFAADRLSDVPVNVDTSGATAGMDSAASAADSAASSMEEVGAAAQSAWRRENKEHVRNC